MEDLTDRVLIEWLPIFKRLELIQGQWKPLYFPPNMCDTRDIPDGADMHPSVTARMKTVKGYHPKNLGFEKAKFHTQL